MTTQRSEVDERLELVYQEAVRGLTHQQGVVESMNGRAGSLIAFLLWPYHNYRFRFATMAAIHRELAVRIKHDLASNWRVIQRLRIALQLSLVLLLFEILAWLLAIARVPFRLG
jgi:hypothetical protein